MEVIASYIRGVCASGIFCAVLVQLLPEKSRISTIFRMLCGIVMVFAVVAPIRDLSLADIADDLSGIQSAKQDYIQLGEDLSREAVSAIIKERTEAYILDKAASLSGEITVDIGLSEDALPIPVSVTIHGNLSPYSRSALSTILVQELGIAKEQQTWICTS